MDVKIIATKGDPTLTQDTPFAEVRVLTMQRMLSAHSKALITGRVSNSQKIDHNEKCISFCELLLKGFFQQANC